MRTYTILFALLFCFLAKAQQPLPDALRVNSYLGDRLAEKYHPRALSNDQGQTIVVWEDTRNGHRELFAQVLDANRNRVGSNINLTPGEIPEDEEVDLTYFPNGDFLVAWSSDDSVLGKIKYAIVKPDGTLEGGIQELPRPEGDFGGNYPSVAAVSDTSFVMAFVPYTFGGTKLQIQVLHRENGPLTERVPLDSTSFRDLEYPDVAVSPEGDLLVVYQQSPSFSRTNIKAIVFDQDEENPGTNILGRISEVEDKGQKPSAVALDNGTFVAIWLDERDNSRGDVYAQLLSDQGLVGNNEKLGTMGGFVTSNRYPRVATDGEEIAVTQVTSATSMTIFESDLDQSGSRTISRDDPFPVVLNNSFGTVFLENVLDQNANTVAPFDRIFIERNTAQKQVNDDTHSGGDRFLSYQMAPDGSGIVLWQDYVDQEFTVFAQWVSAQNERIGDPFVVEDEPSSGYSIAIAEDGSFAIFYYINVDMNSRLIIRFYGPDGRLRNSRQVGAYQGTANFSKTRGLTYNPVTNQYFYWHYESDGFESWLDGRLYDLSGSQVKSDVEFLRESGQSFYNWAVRENGDYVAVYLDYSDIPNYNTKYLVIDKDLNLVTPPTRLNETYGSVDNDDAHDIALGDNGRVHAIYRSEQDVNGIEGPIMVRNIGPDNSLSAEHYIDVPGDLLSQTVHLGQLRLWSEDDGDIFEFRLSPTTLQGSSRRIFEAHPIQEEYRFVRHGGYLSVLFKSIREPGRNFDLYRYLARDTDQDGYFDFRDCDDGSASVFPGAMEVINNDIDEDCNGRDSTQMTTSTLEPFGSEVRVFPNPTTDVLRIQVEASIPYQAILRDMLGRPVRRAANATAFDVAGLEPGMYTLELVRADRKGRYLSRVVITSQR